MTLRKSTIVVLLIIISYGYSVTELNSRRSPSQAVWISQLVELPKQFAIASSFEFSGLVSDYIFMQTLTFMGDKIINKIPLTKKDTTRIYQALSLSSWLDKRFLDPYIIAATTLPFEEGELIEETNQLLKQAITVRTDDYRPYFFLWYNYYYLLHDPKTAAGYLQKGSTIPGAPSYYITLAARMHLYAGQLDGAIIFLREVIKDTTDTTQRGYLEIRLDAIEKIAYLEKKVAEYKTSFHNAPENLQDLIKVGLLSEIPSDPYGGQFYINDRGRVYSTSKLVFIVDKK